MKTALVVEDSKIIRRISAEMLKMLGFAVNEAESAEEAIALCRENRPALALVDLNLPEVSGPDLAAVLRCQPGCEDIKIVLVSVGCGGSGERRDGAPIFNPLNIDGLTDHLTELGVLAPSLAQKPAGDGAILHPYVFSEFSILAMGALDMENVDLAKIAAGSVLCHQTDPSDCAWILISGTIDFFVCQGSVTRHVASAKPFQMFGEVGCLSFEPRLVMAVAAEDCELLQIPRASLLKRLDAMEPFARSWIASLSRQVSGLLRLSSERRRGQGGPSGRGTA